MKIHHRYILLLFILIFYGLFIVYRKRLIKGDGRIHKPSSFMNTDEDPLPMVQRVVGDSLCSMETCFDLSKCKGDRLKVYVYPDEERIEGEQGTSETYSKILSSIRESAFYTSNPSEACLFILSIDTTDRDKISENFVQNMPSLMKELPPDIWNGGSNHIIFNLYHGTYPDYAAEHLGFDTGKAIVARASASSQKFRHGFDVSFPLFHKEHPIRESIDRSYTLTDRDPVLVSFKGKRYVYGIGSETRDSLHHLHCPSRTPMLTTCRHNHDWQAHQDERCEADNAEYDKWDYETLMMNSTFCLTPRGRRLGSFRFLESLRAGCIPVVLSDDWKLPFDEFIDWKSAAVRIPEKNVLLVNDILTSFPTSRILRMKQRGRLLYHRYFASVEKIVLTTLEMVWYRHHGVKTGRTPLTNSLLPFDPFTTKSIRPLVVVISTGDRLNSRLQHALDSVSSLNGLTEVIVLWPHSRGQSPFGADVGLPEGTRMRIIETDTHNDLPLEEISRLLEEDEKELRDASVLFYSDRSTVTTQELIRLLEIFSTLPHTIVTTRGVEYSMSGTTYSSAFANVALLDTAVVHSGYVMELSSFLPSSIIHSCPSSSLSTLISSLSLSPPSILISSHHKIDDKLSFTNLTNCLNLISSRFPLGIPLISANMAFH